MKDRVLLVVLNFFISLPNLKADPLARPAIWLCGKQKNPRPSACGVHPDAAVISGSKCHRPDLNFSQDFFGIRLQVHNLLSVVKKPRQENAMKNRTKKTYQVKKKKKQPVLTHFCSPQVCIFMSFLEEMSMCLFPSCSPRLCYLC